MKPITKVYVRVIGDTSVGIPHQDFQLDVFVDPDNEDETDRTFIREEIRRRFRSLYAFMSGENEKFVRVQFDYELPEEPPFQDIKTGLVYEPYLITQHH